MKQLTFSQEGKFKLLQFTDIHFSDNNEVDKETVELMRKILKEEKPDFIMITGDTVYGEENVDHLPLALTPVIESNIPFSYTFGNHDTEEGQGYEALFEVLQGIPTCMMYHDANSKVGMGNHTLEVVGHDGGVKWVIAGIDSGNYNPLPHMEGYAYVQKPQIEWYQDMMRKYEAQNPDFASLVFMHIPLPEYHEVWAMETCYGMKREGICSPKINSGFFAAMQEVGHTKGVFVGHDHINDFYGEMYGITLGYGRATGYNTYGQEDFLRGARIFILDENNTESFETYVRLSDGTVIDNPSMHLPERVRDDN
ncbi:metallophosphoesterase family protein [Niameybacter massiliensis]|uniref:metallophosphoesterase family protein n=1 Tax=Niameybacter massiliensis TaxID=1658108 RepID=UPI0006B67727|nr:metallophosphoesterase family protein [Niameybacter massiliensis]